MAYGAFGVLNVFVIAKDVNFGILQNDARLGGIFQCELGASSFTGQPTNGSTQVVT